MWALSFLCSLSPNINKQAITVQGHSLIHRDAFALIDNQSVLMRHYVLVDTIFSAEFFLA